MAQRPAIGFRGWIATAGLAGAMLLAGAAAPPMTVLFSPGFRVRVEADSAPAGQVYSTWADPFLQRLYRLLQWEVRPFADRTLTLRLEAAREGQAGDLTAEQPVPGQVEQVLWIYGADGRQRPALEELLTEAALERRVMDRMTPAALQKGIPAVPRWLSVGLARYLDADLRARDARWVGDSVEAGIWPAVSEWVTWRHLPEAYAEEKSFSGQAVAWILSRPAGAAGVQGLLDALAMGRPIDAGQVAARLNFTSIAEAESDWRDWLERQGRVVRFGMEAPRERVRRLTAQLTFTEEELTRAGVPSRLDLTWSALPAHRGQPWLIRLVRRKAADLRLLSIGKEQEFRDLTAEGAAYLDACAGNRFWPPASALRRRYGVWAAKLAAYEQRVAEREAYVDRMESAGPGDRTPVYEPGLEKSALRDYVDAVEARITGGVATPPQP